MVHHLTTAPPDWLGTALSLFERQFTYPLGSGRCFRISHGREYMRFFQAMGEAHLLVGERDQTVLGTLMAVRRLVRFPSGALKYAGYLCDLKIDPEARTGRTFPKLMQAVQDELEIPCEGRGYAIVMDGTARTPERYSRGRPHLKPVAQIMVLRIPTAPHDSPVVLLSAPDAISQTHNQLTTGSYAPASGQPVLRSDLKPIYLQLGDGRACGVLEDTRRGKQLFDETDHEMISAHLSRFAFATPAEGAQLLRAALGQAAQCGFPGLFTSVPRLLAEPLLEELQIPETILAPATIYACGFSQQASWWIDTSEI